jgi:hypothetical protein
VDVCPDACHDRRRHHSVVARRLRRVFHEQFRRRLPVNACSLMDSMFSHRRGRRLGNHKRLSLAKALRPPTRFGAAFQAGAAGTPAGHQPLVVMLDLVLATAAWLAKARQKRKNSCRFGVHSENLG